MSRFHGFLLAGLARLLEADRRDIVMGDLAELNLGPLRSLGELCGLIARQQVNLWKAWRPWLALLGIVGLVGIRLNFLASSLTMTPWRNLSTYLKYGARYERGLTGSEEFIVWISVAAAVMLWSWTAGFVFTSLSRKTVPVAGALLCLAWLCSIVPVAVRSRFVLPWFYILLWLIPSMVFFLPAIWGAKRAFRRGDLPLRQAIVLLVITAGAIAVVTWTSGWPEAALERWSEGAIREGMPWFQRLLRNLFLSLPAAWIVASSARNSSMLWRLDR